MYRDDFDRNGFQEKGADDIYSKPVRAGKRTYFFDVKSTRGADDFFITITESKRRTERDGSFSYDKHKIFLYKEDFEKFAEGLQDAVAYIRDNCYGGEIPVRTFPEAPADQEAAKAGGSDISFEDL